MCTRCVPCVCMLCTDSNHAVGIFQFFGNVTYTIYILQIFYNLKKTLFIVWLCHTIVSVLVVAYICTVYSCKLLMWCFQFCCCQGLGFRLLSSIKAVENRLNCLICCVHDGGDHAKVLVLLCFPILPIMKDMYCTCMSMSSCIND